MIRISITAALLLVANMSYAKPANIDGLYQKNCASCHGSNRLGGMGPALLPENLKRLRQKKAIKVIAMVVLPLKCRRLLTSFQKKKSSL